MNKKYNPYGMCTKKQQKEIKRLAWLLGNVKRIRVEIGDPNKPEHIFALLSKSRKKTLGYSPTILDLVDHAIAKGY